ncbi:MAG: gluconate 2-dehydrogenase subunit 3 family protein [Thermoleophilaceae bacterium]|nr:gluconate 2-dehydrogenase subunit 3 family protein [Thermoleophilaceae bacterium]
MHGGGGDPDGLPRQRRGTTPQMHGRYPDFDVLEQSEHWDEPTRRAVLARLDPPSLRFFDATQARTLTAFCDTVLAQDRQPRVPVLQLVDAKLHEGRLDGFQYDDMPDDRETWRLVARGLDEAAAEHDAASYGDADPESRLAICEAFAEARLSGGVWVELPVAHAFAVVMRAVLAAFYSHPWAWNEIGFGGPAHPRGYMRLGIGQKEPWEGEEAFVIDPVADVRERGLDHPTEHRG